MLYNTLLTARTTIADVCYDGTAVRRLFVLETAKLGNHIGTG